MHLGEQWELVKESFKMKAVERSTVLRFHEKQKENELKMLLSKLTALECKVPGVYHEDIHNIKKKLEVLDEERCRGALERSRAEALAGVEMPTKRFLGLEKKHARRKQTEAIESDGFIGIDSRDIGRAFRRHFQNLFAFRRVKMSRLKELFLSRMPRLSEEVRLH